MCMEHCLLTNCVLGQIIDVRYSKFSADHPFRFLSSKCMLQIKKLTKEHVPISRAVSVVLTICWAWSTFMVLSSNKKAEEHIPF